MRNTTVNFFILTNTEINACTQRLRNPNTEPLKHHYYSGQNHHQVYTIWSFVQNHTIVVLWTRSSMGKNAWCYGMLTVWIYNMWKRTFYWTHWRGSKTSTDKLIHCQLLVVIYTTTWGWWMILFSRKRKITTVDYIRKILYALPEDKKE